MTSGDATVHPAREEDWPAVRDLWTREGKLLGPLFRVCPDYQRGGRPDLAGIWVAEVGGAVVGFARTRRAKRTGEMFLQELCVAKAHRRGGVARALLAHLPRPCEVHTDEENEAARACYERCGWIFGGLRDKRKGDGRRIAVYYRG